MLSGIKFMKLSKYLVLFGFVAATISGSLLTVQQKKTELAKAEVVLTEPDGDLKLETGKIKGYTEHHFETMKGPSGDEVTSYVFSATGNTSIYPEIRFITDGTQTVTKPYDLVAEETVEVHFWYKLVNSSPKNVNDGDWPYLLQVLGTDGTYPNHPWTPVVDGEWHLAVLATDDYHDKFAGMLVKMGDINGSLTIANIKTYSTTVVDLETVFPESFAMTFNYDYIDTAAAEIVLTEQIFTLSSSTYMNDHANDFKDVDNNVIPLHEGIIINDHPFSYWVAYQAENYTYPRNAGVFDFPLYAGKQYGPVSIEARRSAHSLAFKFNLEVFPMDSVVITFKAGLFYGYRENNTYVLDKDLTYYASIGTTGAITKTTFTKTQNWTTTHLGIRTFDDWSEQTASQGGKFHKWLMWTDIPRDTANITQGCPVDNYRYMYDNILMNGKPLTYYNAWARGNSKDFTDLADTSTQNPDYELGHPTGAISVNFDLAVRIEVITDQPNYVMAFSIPNQLVTDLSLGEGMPTFTLRDGSAWLSIKNDVTHVYRYSAQDNADFAVVKAFAEQKMHMNDYNENLGYCNDAEHHYYLTAKAAYNALTDSQKAMFASYSDFAATKARFEQWAAFNNDADPYDGNDAVVSTLHANNFVALKDENGCFSIVAIISIISVLSVSILFVTLRKKKTNK